MFKVLSSSFTRQTQQFSLAPATKSALKPSLLKLIRQFSAEKFSDEKIREVLKKIVGPDGEVDLKRAGNPKVEEVYDDEYALFGVNPRTVEKVNRPPPIIKPKEITKQPVIDDKGRSYGTGRRKAAVARVWIKPGEGNFLVNRKLMTDYFVRSTYQHEIVRPFLATGTAADFDVYCTVKGGGHTGQAGAIRLGLSRALENYNPFHRPSLKKEGFLTRDARVVERKKPGQKKARKKCQW
eukprot:CAMPEP_0117753584 /NCGR_PEP_ID=MMETSP0947-20121206/12319_1 /TAXON_ID=44440 /ORGANISM="Chattonella subsalsa, Strain CCMP2191" /LENGTH=237 /DNA_ID=CAMNT_0005572507 /DNA_START=113 /DNA_END=823 /DNA_ORIENTATION=-